MAHYFDSTATMLSGLRGLDLESMGIPSDKEYMEEYCKNMGIPSIADTWNFYLCFGFFRMAAILQGVYKRSLEGRSSSVCISSLELESQERPAVKMQNKRAGLQW